MKKTILSLSVSCIALSGFSQENAKSVIKNNPLPNGSIERIAIPACATTNGGWLLGGNTIGGLGGPVIGTCDANDLVFEAGGVSSIWLKTATNQVGIGTSNPSGKLDISTSGTLNGLNVLNGTANLFSVASDGSTVVRSTYSTANIPLTIYGSNGTSVTAYLANAAGNKTFFMTGAGGAGYYNGIVKQGDNAIIWDNGTNGGTQTTGFVIAPWDGLGGIRIDAVTGNIGINNSTPLARLDVVGNNSSTSLFAVRNTSFINPYNTTYATTAFEVATNGQVFIGPFRQKSTSTHANAILSVDGEVVVGDLGGHGLWIVQDNWSDYVFDIDYKLLSLDEVEKFYKVNHHLPDVPTAKNIKENGVNVGQTETILLKKIEELTLYIVQQQKEMENQKKDIEALKSIIKN